MAVTDWIYAGTVVSSGAGAAWSSPGNATAEDGTVTANSLLLQNLVGQQLKATNFPFPDLTGATITGIEVRYKIFAFGGNSTVTYNVVRLLFAGTLTGQNKATGNLPTTEQNVIWGNGSDLWQTAPTPSDVANTNFGAVLQCKTTAGNTGVASVDAVSMRITYTPAASASVRSLVRGLVNNSLVNNGLVSCFSTMAWPRAQRFMCHSQQTLEMAERWHRRARLRRQTSASIRTPQARRGRVLTG